MIVTEKLASGTVFSPIHPQPVTSVGTKVAVVPSVTSMVPSVTSTLLPQAMAMSASSGVSSVLESVTGDALLQDSR